MEKNTTERCRPQMTIWRMCIACWITKATDTTSEYVILIAFTTCLSVTLCIVRSHLHNIKKEIGRMETGKSNLCIVVGFLEYKQHKICYAVHLNVLQRAAFQYVRTLPW